jgi:hypothetical protein
MAPHRCAAVPFISGLNSTKGFIDTGSEMPGGADHHIYVSVEAVEQMAQIIDWSPPAAVAALQELCGCRFSGSPSSRSSLRRPIRWLTPSMSSSAARREQRRWHDGLKDSASAGAYQQMTVTTVVRPRRSPPAQATYAIIIPETNGIRWRDDGTNPTAAIGMPVAAGATLVYDGDLSAIKIVSQTGTSTVNVSYFGPGSCIYAERNAAAGNDILKFEETPGAGTIRLTYRDDAGTINQPASIGTITSGAWRQAAVVKSGTAVTFVLDGASDGGGGTLTATNTFTDVLRCQIGDDPVGGTTPFNGSLANVALYNVAVPLATLTAHWNAR